MSKHKSPRDSKMDEQIDTIGGFPGKPFMKKHSLPVLNSCPTTKYAASFPEYSTGSFPSLVTRSSLPEISTSQSNTCNTTDVQARENGFNRQSSVLLENSGTYSVSNFSSI